MAELTAEQLKAAESMTADELRALALDEVETDTGTSTEVEDETEVENTNDEPEETIYRREIDTGEGSGVQVFESDSLEGLVDKLAKAQINATKKIRELSAKVKTEVVKTAQQTADEEFMISERMKKNPKQTIKELAAEAIREAVGKDSASKEAQEHFVSTHDDYIAIPENGNKLVAELKHLGYTEITVEGLEKAYQSLKASGLLKLKNLEAGSVTDEEAGESERIAQEAAEATQRRSRKTGSGISGKSGVRTATTAVNQGPTEDEVYKMPLEKIRELADKQLREQNQ